jgi:hypothetical protein
MSSTKMSKLFAEWWCGSLAKKPAVVRRGAEPQQDFRKVKRQLGVVSTNDPGQQDGDPEGALPGPGQVRREREGPRVLLRAERRDGRPAEPGRHRRHEQPAEPGDERRLLLRPGRPAVLLQRATNNNYWPETLFATNQAMDTDTAGQTYMGDLACPQKNRGCAFDGALGLGQSERAVAPEQLGGMKVFKASSKSPTTLQPLIIEIFWQNYNMLGSLIQAPGRT